MVRLRLLNTSLLSARSHSFNPTVVRLRPTEAEKRCREALAFNPTVVRLRRVTPTETQFAQRAFNPTVVRLRHCRHCGNSSVFQSHCGAIATCISVNFSDKETALSIPLWCDCDDVIEGRVEGILRTFNPTVVRLRQPSRDKPC